MSMVLNLLDDVDGQPSVHKAPDVLSQDSPAINKRMLTKLVRAYPQAKVYHNMTLSEVMFNAGQQHVIDFLLRESRTTREELLGCRID